MLNTLRTPVDDHNLFYWRDKCGGEVDFIINSGRQQSDAIECKINPDHFDPAHITVFRSLYPEGKNDVLSPAIKSSCQRRYGKLKANFISIKQIYKLKWSGYPLF